MRSFVLGVAVLAGMGVAAYLLYTLLVGLAPPGLPMARAGADVAYNDPNDLSPREPALPAGPHLDEFVINCTACHSTRLTMTQPAFAKAKWGEVVHKMVATYGAKITPDVEGQIVEYLAAVKGAK